MTHKPHWRYCVTVGLRGCYMPNYHGGCVEGTTRRELAKYVREQIRMFADQEDNPAESSLFAQTKIKNLWHHIKRHGSSSAHFSIDIGRGEEIAFHGLTEDEYNNMLQDDEA